MRIHRNVTHAEEFTLGDEFSPSKSDHEAKVEIERRKSLRLARTKTLTHFLQAIWIQIWNEIIIYNNAKFDEI